MVAASEPEPRVSPSTFARTAALLVAALALALALHPIDDFDFWSHLAVGRLIWQTGAWPVTNTFSFTAPEHPWIDLPWLFQVVVYAVDRLAGVGGCVVFVGMAAVATASILYLHARRFVGPAVAALLMAVALLVAAPRLQPRPESLAYVFFALFVVLLDDHSRRGWSLYALVSLTILWVNTHATFALGLALIGCHWLGAALALLPLPRALRVASACDQRAFRRLTAVAVLAALACVLNPYGVAGARFPLERLSHETVGVIAQHLGELQLPTGPGWMLPTALAMTALAFLANVPRWHLGRLLAAVVFGYLASRKDGDSAFFAWVAVPAIAGNLGDLLAARRSAGTTSGSYSALGRAAVVVAFAVLLATIVTNRFWPALGIDREFGVGVSGLRFSDDAIAFAERVGISGRPFNTLSMGGYLLWNRFPPERVFVDRRREAYPDALFRKYFEAINDPAGWPALARQYEFDYAFLHHGSPSMQAMINGLVARYGWTLVYYDDTTSVLLPGDERHRALRERATRAFETLRRERRTAPVAVSWRLAVEAFERARISGDLLTVVGRHEEARAAYARAVALRPDSSEARFALASSEWRAGAHAEAQAEWADIVRRDPGYRLAHDALADPARIVVETAPPR